MGQEQSTLDAGAAEIAEPQRGATQPAQLTAHGTAHAQRTERLQQQQGRRHRAHAERRLRMAEGVVRHEAECVVEQAWLGLGARDGAGLALPLPLPLPYPYPYPYPYP